MAAALAHALNQLLSPPLAGRGITLKVTVIGVFAVAAEKQQDLVEAIERAGEVVCKLPGFLGSTLYASVDGAKVVNQSHWASIEEHNAVLEVPEAVALAEAMFAIAKPDPIICVERGELSPAEV